jgi:restriction system protein
MAKRSLFSILSEQPWWVTLLVAMALFAIVQLIYPPFAPFVALPFVVFAAYFAWQQRGSLSPVRVDERLAVLREMPWEKFGPLISEAYRRQGFGVEEARSSAFDFKLRRNGRVTLVQCRRWKVNQLGVGPVRELYEAMEKQEAFSCVCIAAGEFTSGAREFAAGKPISLVNGTALAQLAGPVERTGRRWWFGP